MEQNLLPSTPPIHTRAVTLALRSFVKRHNLPRKEWLVACSGGPDSLALTIAVADLSSRLTVPMRAVIVDHGLREESSEEAKRTQAILSKLGIDASVKRVSVSNIGGIEAAARQARYDALRESAAPFSVVFLGHTMDDQAETVLLGLGRGSGTRSLSGMRQIITDTHTFKNASLTWARPLLDVRRWDTEGMCAELGLQPALDPSNELQGGWTTRDGLPLPRVGVRHRAIPALSEALGKDVVPLLARSANLLDQDASALEQIAGQHLQSGSELYVDELKELPVAVRSRVLKEAASNAGAIAITQNHVAALGKLVEDYQGGDAINLPGKVQAWREKQVDPRDGSVRRLIRIIKTS